MSLLSEQNPDLVQEKRQQLHIQLADLLGSHENTALNAAFSQAPAQEVWLELSRAVQTLVEATPDNTNPYGVFFAIPVIIVAGCDKETSLPCRINPTEILQLLRVHGVLADHAPACISSLLISADALGSISPSSLMEWKTRPYPEMPGDALKLFEFSPESVTVKEESAWLRFMVGMVQQYKDAPTAIHLGGNVGKWGMPLAQMLGEMLKQGNVSILALPRPVQSWLTANETGRRVLLETRLQLLVSNAVRAIRSKQRTPVGVIAAHANEEIRITVSSQEDSERWYGFIWPLAPGEQVETIAKYAQDLFHDCRIEDVRLIEAVQPDLDDNLPFFVTAHFAPKGEIA